MKQRHSFGWVLRLFALDLLMLMGGGVIFIWLRGGLVVLGSFTYLAVALIVGVVVSCLALIGAYDRYRDMRTLEYASEHLLTMGVALALSFTVTYGVASYESVVKPSRSALLLGLLAFAPCSLAYRRFFSFRERRLAGDRFFAVAGTEEMARDLYAATQQGGLAYPLRFFSLAETVDKPNLVGENSPRVERDLKEILAQSALFCEGVIIAMPFRDLGPHWADFLLELHFRHVPVYPLESFFELYLKKVPLARLHLAWALKDGFEAAGHQVFDKIKRMLDVGMSSVALLLLSPWLILLALLIRAEDGGSVIYCQSRVGRFGQIFTLYKFRTMQEARAGDEPYTQPNDVRITRVGRWLRRFRLDELPQFWNVWWGDMSLIGPRAEWDQLVAIYQNEIPYYHLRHLVKPGITGWAQVNYPYGAGVEDAREKLQFDLYYLKNYSLRLDAAIVLKTLYVMFAARGR